MKNPVLKSVLILVASAGMASADTTVTFDDLPMMTGPATIDNGYQGLDWSNFSYRSGTGRGLATSGFSKGTVSGPNVAFNNSSDPSVLSSSTPFNLDSADLTGAWRSGLQLEVKGFKPGDSTPDYDSIYTLTSTGPTLINFDFLGVDKVEFSSFGGASTLTTAVGVVPETFVMDNLTLGRSPVSAPDGGSTMVMFGAAASVIGFLRKKQIS
jgi:opacity protein-like surface antigen